MNLYPKSKAAAAGKAECVGESQTSLKAMWQKGFSWLQKLEGQRTQRVEEKGKGRQKHCKGVSTEGVPLGSNLSGSRRLSSVSENESANISIRLM